MKQMERFWWTTLVISSEWITDNIILEMMSKGMKRKTIDKELKGAKTYLTPAK